MMRPRRSGWNGLLGSLRHRFRRAKSAERFTGCDLQQQSVNRVLQFVLIAPVLFYHTRCCVATDIESIFDVVIPNHLHTNDRDDPEPTALIAPWMLFPFYWRNAYQIPEAAGLRLHHSYSSRNERSQFVCTDRFPVQGVASISERLP